MDAFGRIIAIILAVVLIVLFPLQYLAMNQEAVIESHVHSETTEFANDIMLQGNLTVEMYTSFIDKLDATNQLYDIELIHSKPMEGFDTGNIGISPMEEKLEQTSANTTHTIEKRVLNASFTDKGNSNTSLNHNHKHDAEGNCIYEGEKKGEKEEQKEEQEGFITLGQAKGTGKVVTADNFGTKDSFSLMAAHTHTEACYAGHRHTDSCYTYFPLTDVYTGPDVPITVQGDRVEYDFQDGVPWIAIREKTSGHSIGSVICYVDDDGYGRPTLTDTTKLQYMSVGSVFIEVSQQYLASDLTIKYTGKRIQQVFESSTPVVGLTGYYVSSRSVWRYYTPGFVALYNRYSASQMSQSVGQSNHPIYDADATTMQLLRDLGYDTRLSCPSCMKAGTLSKNLITNNRILTCTLPQDETPVCSQVITSITPTNPNQTLFQGQSAIITATATYLDGHTGIIACSSNYNGNIGTQTVTLSYYSRIYNAKTYGYITCTETITTKLNTKACTAGLGHPDYSGELAKCPICSAIAGLSANNVTVKWDGAQHGITVNNATGVATIVYYDIDPGAAYNWSTTTAPSAVGNYLVHIYVTGNWGSWFAIERSITIYRELSSITVTPSSYTVYNGSEPTYTVRANYTNNTSSILSSGYTKTGFTRGAGPKTVTFTYSENGITVSASVPIIVLRNLKTCVNGHTYELDDYNTDYGCPYCKQIIDSVHVAPEYITVEKGNSLNINITATYLDGHTIPITSGWTSNFNTNQIGNQLVTVTYEGKSAYVSVTVVETLICPICGTEYSPNEDGTDPGCPICSIKVISISATPATQIVPIGENITVEVIATYQDGHSAVVDDWTSNYNSHKIGLQNVTVFYKTLSTTITVIVESETQTTCPICGTVYSPIEYPYGCPSCSKIVVSIEAKLRNGGTQVQYGSELRLAVVLIYKDGHREIAYNDWSVEGYQAEVLGMQTLTVTYKELQTTLTIEVINSLSKTVCINGHVYYLNADGSDPGCPYCSIDGTTESSQDYFECFYTDTILEELYANGIYYFEAGDYITVTVIPKPFTFLDKLQNMFSMAASTETKYSYGGIIGNGEYF